MGNHLVSICLSLDPEALLKVQLLLHPLVFLSRHHGHFGDEKGEKQLRTTGGHTSGDKQALQPTSVESFDGFALLFDRFPNLLQLALIFLQL